MKTRVAILGLSVALLAGAGAATATSKTNGFSNGRAEFSQVRKMLSNQYYTELDDDALYYAAIRGMLEYADPSMGKWNAVLTPAELSALRTDLSGSIVGVGIAIGLDDDTKLAHVQATLPDSPAGKAGIKAGDILIRVDDEVVQGMALPDLVSRIRGDANTTVALTVLRAGELVTVNIRREAVQLAATTHGVLDDDIGYLRIYGYHERTAPAARAALEELSAAGVKGLIVDLRHNHGGALEPALETADLLLPSGTPIITMRHRERGRLIEDAKIAKTDPILRDIPMAVLIDEKTASSAELTAVALQHDGATLVGTKTFGKWSAQWLAELDNGYGVKFTTSLIEGADGHSYNDTGVQPDVEVASGALPPGVEVPPLSSDAALRTAHTLLTARRR